MLKFKNYNEISQRLVKAVHDNNRQDFTDALAIAQKGDGHEAMEVALESRLLHYVEDLVPLCQPAHVEMTVVDAAQYGCSSIVERLVEMVSAEVLGHDVLATALCQAIAYQHLECVTVLLPHVDTTLGSSYPLQQAASSAKRSDCPILQAVLEVSNPNDAILALRSRQGKDAAIECLEQCVSWKQRNTIQQHIASEHTTRSRKI